MNRVGFDEAGRRALLTDFERRGPVRTLWLGPPAVAATTEVAARTGLHPALTALVPVVGGYEGDEAGSRFYRDLLTAIPAGTDGLAIVRRWYQAVWDAPSVGPALALRDTPAFAPAAAIVAMVRDSMARPIAPGVWRAARAALSQAEQTAGGDILFTEPVLAMAWDLDTMPGASADVFHGWGKAAMDRAQADMGWATADTGLIAPLIETFNRRVIAELGRPAKADADWMARYRAALARCWAERPDLAGLKARYDACVAGLGTAQSAVIDAARRTLLACAAKQAAVAPDGGPRIGFNDREW